MSTFGKVRVRGRLASGEEELFDIVSTRDVGLRMQFGFK